MVMTLTQDLSLAENNLQGVKSKVDFTHLHLHTPWSLLDGFCRIDDMIELAKEYDMDSVGVSEHGNCNSHFEFYTKCKAAGIKPILGCEVYITPNRYWKKADFDKVEIDKEQMVFVTKKQMKEEDLVQVPDEFLTKEELEQQKAKRTYYFAVQEKAMVKQFEDWRPRMAHLLLIAKDNEGYQNLLTLTKRAYLEGFYRKPRTDYELIKKYGKGLIATTACLGGEVPQLIRSGKYGEARKIIAYYQECFDELYLEIQPSDQPEQLLVNEVLTEWSEELGIPLVATSDAHMLRKEEKPIHAALTTIGKSEDASDISVYEHCYFMSANEMIGFGIPEVALRNAHDIAQRCNVELEIGKTRYPKFEVPEGYSFDTYLAQLSNQALFNLALNNDIDINLYQKRMNYELDIIKQKKIPAYFLIVRDYIKFAKDNHILVGPGRGSAAGSMVSYLLGITNLDPIKYNLMFERFINPERPGFPDVDTDFDYVRRHEVIDYVTEKYGEEQVAQIGTYTTLSTKAAFKDIGRGLEIDHNIINDMNKLIPIKFGTPYSIDEALKEVPALREYKEKYPELFELASKVQNLPRSSSIHACGLLISPDPVDTISPIMRGKEGEIVTQYDGPTLEKLGAIKFDFLGLKNLSVLSICRTSIYERHGIDIDPDRLEPDDPKVFKMIQDGWTDGMFQIESDGMKKVFKGLNAVNFESLIAGVSLYRPGPMDFIPQYQNRANGMEEVEYPHENLREVLENTFGVVVYQEQLMEMTAKLAGYSAGAQDTFRKAVGKKDEKVMKPALEQLEKDIIAYGHTPDLSAQIINIIAPFLGYGFNRSHAAAYAYIAYQTAYFKTYYPREFMAALLTIFGSDLDRATRYIADSKRMGISILPPDINNSDLGFTIQEDNIRYGLGSIKGLGEAAVQTIMESRPFKSLEDLVSRVPKRQLNKRAIKTLALSGGLDNLSEKENRMSILQDIYYIRGDKDDISDEVLMFKDKMKLEVEKDLLGVFVSGHPLDGHAKQVNWDFLDDFEPVDTAGFVTSFKEITTKKGDKMAMVNIDTLEGAKKLVLFPNIWEGVVEEMQKDLIIKFTCYTKYNFQYDNKDIIVKKITIPKRINKDVLQR
jgi:DNA polymerase-3 subunit alpha